MTPVRDDRSDDQRRPYRLPWSVPHAATTDEPTDVGRGGRWTTADEPTDVGRGARR